MSAPVTTVLDLVARHEGFRALPYCDKCGGGIVRLLNGWSCSCPMKQAVLGGMTIGYGLNLEVNGLREDEARAILRNRLTTISADRTIIDITARLDYVRAAVVVDLAFNLGIDGLLKFQQMLKDLSAGMYNAAAVELRKSLAAHQESRRILELAKMLETGAMPEGEF